VKTSIKELGLGATVKSIDVTVAAGFNPVTLGVAVNEYVPAVVTSTTYGLLEKFAIPLTTGIESVELDVKVPPAGPEATLSAIDPDAVVTTLPLLSSTKTLRD
jgi:hypothetical protein